MDLMKLIWQLLRLRLKGCTKIEATHLDFETLKTFTVSAVLQSGITETGLTYAVLSLEQVGRQHNVAHKTLGTAS